MLLPGKLGASADAARVAAIARGAGYDGPRGRVHLDGATARQRIYLATADGTEFDVLASL